MTAAAGDKPGEVPSLVPGLNQALGRVLRAYRTARGFDLPQVAQALRMPLRSVTQTEEGLYPVSMSQLFRYAELYGAPVWGLISSVDRELSIWQAENGHPRFTDSMKTVQDLGYQRAMEAKAAQAINTPRIGAAARPGIMRKGKRA